jgi:glutamyl-tRNA synthetase
LNKGAAYEKDGAVYIKGDMEKKIDDFVIIKSDGFPVYNFAVVIDDATMQMSHVIRGDDHISNTPRQVLIYKALGLPIPKIIHVPMILGADGERLSKRHGATSVTEFRTMGYLPEAMVNYLARLGWSHGDQEFFTVDELIKKFSLGKLGKSPSTFDPQKLDWINAEHIKHATAARLKEFIPVAYRAHAHIDAMIDLVKSRTKTLDGLAKALAYFMEDTISIEADAEALLTPAKKEVLKELAAVIEPVTDWSKENLEKTVREFAEKKQLPTGEVIHPLRAALTGTKVSPGIFEVMELISKEKALHRLYA